MVNNYPEYAAGVNYKKTDSNNVTHFYSAQVVADPSDDTIESKLIKDGVVISEGGGGGSSDFSTAEVTLIGKDGSLAGDVYLPITQQATGDEMPDVAYFLANFVANEQHTFNAIMYKGAVAGHIDNTAAHSIDSIIGNAQDLGGGYLLITGDCTITIS